MNRTTLAVQALALAAIAVLLDWPILAGGGVLYFDNPAHLSEISALSASQSGWSDAAMAGIDVSTLHSPLWYGLLTWIERIGGPVEALYCAALVVAHLAPALALLAVGARIAPGWWPFAIALLHLVTRTQLVGMTSVLGGMWTWSIAQAAVLLALDRLRRGIDTRSQAAAAAAWIGLAAFSHLFALFVLAFTGPIAAAWGAAAGDAKLARLARAAAATAVAAAATTGYWLPALGLRDGVTGWEEPIDLPTLWRMLALPIDLNDPIWAATTGFSLPWWAGAPIAIVSLGAVATLVAGVVRAAGRARSPRAAAEPAPATQGWRPDAGVAFALMAGAVLVGLTVAAATGAHTLGPLPHRMLNPLRLLLGAAAVGALAGAPRRVTSAASAVALAAAIAAGASSAGELRARALTPVHPDAIAIEAALADLATRDVGDARVAIQDTFLARPYTSPAAASHAFALAYRRTGHAVVGPWYGVGPFATRAWAVFESERVFGHAVETEQIAARIAAGMQVANATTLIAFSPEAVVALDASPQFARLAAHGRYVTYALTAPPQGWVQPLNAATQVRPLERGDGRVVFAVGPSNEPRQVRVAWAWSPHWTVTSDQPGATLTAGPDGLIAVTVPPGQATGVALDFSPAAWPRLAVPAGIALLALLALLAVGPPRARAPAAT